MSSPHVLIVMVMLAGKATASTFDVTKFGAKGDGKTDSTKAVQQTFDAIKKAGSGTVLFPKGSYVFGPVQLDCDGTNLKDAVIEFAKGATMSSLTDAKQWAKIGDDYVPWIQVSSCTGLTIHGGTFEGHNSYWDFLKNKKQDNPRPYMMQFSDVTGFKAHDMILKNSPHTHFKIARGTNVEIYNMHLETNMNTENTDGIMLANVETGHVHNVWIQNGDDCLKANDNSKHVTFENGTCIGGHGLSIGGGGEELEIEDITFSNFDLQDMSNGARIKFTSKTTGSIKDVTYEKLRMKHVKAPLFITTGYQSVGLGSSQRSLKMSNINYIDITAKDDKSVGGSGGDIKNPGDFECDKTAPCMDLNLKGVTMSTKTKWAGKSVGGKASSVKPDASNLFNNGVDLPQIVV